MIHGITSKIQPSSKIGIKGVFHAATITLGLLLPLNYAIKKNYPPTDTFQIEQTDLKKDAQKDIDMSKIWGMIGLGMLSVGAGSMRHDDIESKINSKK